MYYSIKDSASSVATRMATMSSADLTAQMLKGPGADVAFESSIAAMASIKGFAANLLADYVLNPPPDTNANDLTRKSVQIGVVELGKALKTDNAFRAFLGQLLQPVSRVRFVAVGKEEGIAGARNRAAAMAYAAISTDGDKAKTAYVDHMKSLQKLVTTAVDKDQMTAEDGLSMVQSVEKAATAGLPFEQRAAIDGLHERVRHELLEEARQRLRAQYARAHRPDDTPTP
ncbi:MULTISPECIES: hypothetical protein [Cupriavidus]